MNPNPFRWIEIYVQDMERALQFYRAVFQRDLQKLDVEHEMYTFPMSQESSGASGALIKIEGMPSGWGGIVPYFGSNDCAIEVERARQAGGIVKMPKRSIGAHGFIAHILDSEGNLIGIHSVQ